MLMEAGASRAPYIKIAVITVGQPRTVAHPAAAASYAHLISSLQHASVHHFMWLSQAPPPWPSRGLPVVPRTPAERQALAWARPLNDRAPEWPRLLSEYYKPTRLVVSNASLPCRRQCGLRCSSIRHDAPIEFMRQFYAVGLAWLSVMRYERDEMRGRSHDWYLKRRPDLLHLQPLPVLQSLDRHRFHVASGVMTRASKYQTFNDHLVLCASRGECEPYMLLVERTYLVCDRGFRMPWPPQALYAQGALAQAISLLPHAYTVARPDTGPECIRLRCARDPFATGCVARHLPAAVPLCERIAQSWFASNRSSEPT